MKLYIKQKVFSWKDRFSVKNENEEDVFFVEGELFSFGKKLHIFDARNAEVAFIRQQIFTFLPRYFVSVNGTEVAEIVKEFTFFKPRYSIKGLDWQVEGDFFAHDYTVHHNNHPIVRIRKEWMTWGDTYELDIAEGVDAVSALSVVLAIDCVMANNKN